MPIEDAERWNKRYLEQIDKPFLKPREFLIEHADLLPNSGLAFEAAMGLGANARFLIERGLHVIGADISWVAVHSAKTRSPGLNAVLADLCDFWLPENTFDLIMNFYYLDRSLWNEYRRALKPGGMLVIETLTIDMRKIHKDINEKYLLSAGELAREFSDLEILVAREGWIERDGKQSAIASLIARAVKP